MIRSLRLVLRLGFRLRAFYERRFGLGGIGVRTAIFEGTRVLLVRHTYLDGLYFPGGGIKRGEAPSDAAVRETWEETGLRIGTPKPFGDYAVGSNGGRVILFVARAADGVARAGDWEIDGVDWYPIDALPSDVSPATRRRIAEITRNVARATDW